MLFITSFNDDPYFNMAVEEFLLKNFSEEIFMLWQNSNCLVVGKHQNAMAEINLLYVYQKKIPVVRRLTGGGTVFHDKGNINFTFIKNADDVGHMVDFRKYANPILKSLNALGLSAVFSSRNDIFIGNKKVSGNAEHVDQRRKRVLHHGTLLFQSNLKTLTSALKTDPERFLDKAVASVRSEVTNIAEHLSHPLTIDEFFKHVFEFVFDSSDGAKKYQLSEIDLGEIAKLAKEKYRTWDWNFGYSPKYELKRNIIFPDQTLELLVSVEKGLINKVEIISGTLPSYFKSLQGLKHQPEVLKKHFLNHMSKPEADKLMWQFF